MSNWEILPLSGDQIRYDAYICICIKHCRTMAGQDAESQVDGLVDAPVVIFSCNVCGKKCNYVCQLEAHFAHVRHGQCGMMFVSARYGHCEVMLQLY